MAVCKVYFCWDIGRRVRSSAVPTAQCFMLCYYNCTSHKAAIVAYLCRALGMCILYSTAARRDILAGSSISPNRYPPKSLWFQHLFEDGHSSFFVISHLNFCSNCKSRISKWFFIKCSKTHESFSFNCERIFGMPIGLYINIILVISFCLVDQCSLNTLACCMNNALSCMSIWHSIIYLLAFLNNIVGNEKHDHRLLSIILLIVIAKTIEPPLF